MIPSDTPEHIKKIQLEIWLAKTPYERLKIFMDDNVAMLKVFDRAKTDMEKGRQKDQMVSG